jgi:F5/8 type C domain
VSDFAPHNMTGNALPTPYVASASSFYTSFNAYKAFDGSVGTNGYWIGTGAGTDWLQLDQGVGNTNTLFSYSIRANTIPEPLRCPNSWTMQGSNDGTTFTVVDTRTGQTSWGSGEIRAFNCATATTAYRYFRLNITANNGDATYTDVGELFLYTTISPSLTASPNAFALTMEPASFGLGVLALPNAFALTLQPAALFVGASGYELLAAPLKFSFTLANAAEGFELDAAPIPFALALAQDIGLFGSLFITASPLSFSLNSGFMNFALSPIPPPAPVFTANVMPNLIGYQYEEALLILQQVNIYNPGILGYFGTFPISILWEPGVAMTQNAFAFGVSGFAAGAFGASSFSQLPGFVIAQTPAMGASVKVNSPVLLTVAEFPINTAFP